MPEGGIGTGMVAALEREVAPLVKDWNRVPHRHEGRDYVFFVRQEMVCVCGGIGAEAARRAAEAMIALYRPVLLLSVGFAGALDPTLSVGDIFTPAMVLNARDGSRFSVAGGDEGTLLTFMQVADAAQKRKLGAAYGAQAIDMEAAAVAAAASARGIGFGAVKAISDAVDFEMPEADRFVDERGQFRTASFVAFSVFRPWLWVRVAVLARNSGRASRALAEHFARLRDRQQEVLSGTFEAKSGTSTSK